MGEAIARVLACFDQSEEILKISIRQDLPTYITPVLTEHHFIPYRYLLVSIGTVSSSLTNGDPIGWLPDQAFFCSFASGSIINLTKMGYVHCTVPVPNLFPPWKLFSLLTIVKDHSKCIWYDQGCGVSSFCDCPCSTTVVPQQQTLIDPIGWLANYFSDPKAWAHGTGTGTTRGLGQFRPS